MGNDYEALHQELTKFVARTRKRLSELATKLEELKLSDPGSHLDENTKESIVERAADTEDSSSFALSNDTNKVVATKVANLDPNDRLEAIKRRLAQQIESTC